MTVRLFLLLAWSNCGQFVRSSWYHWVSCAWFLSEHDELRRHGAVGRCRRRHLLYSPTRHSSDWRPWNGSRCQFFVFRSEEQRSWSSCSSSSTESAQSISAAGSRPSADQPITIPIPIRLLPLFAFFAFFSFFSFTTASPTGCRIPTRTTGINPHPLEFVQTRGTIPTWKSTMSHR